LGSRRGSANRHCPSRPSALASATMALAAELSRLPATQEEFEAWCAKLDGSEIGRFEFLYGCVVAEPPSHWPHGKLDAAFVHRLASRVEDRGHGRPAVFSQSFPTWSSRCCHPPPPGATAARSVISTSGTGCASTGWWIRAGARSPSLPAASMASSARSTRWLATIPRDLRCSPTSASARPRSSRRLPPTHPHARSGKQRASQR